MQASSCPTAEQPHLSLSQSWTDRLCRGWAYPHTTPHRRYGLALAALLLLLRLLLEVVRCWEAC